MMETTRGKSKAALKTQLEEYSKGACTQLERPGNGASIRNWVTYSAAAASTFAAATAVDAGVIYSGIRNIMSGPNLDGPASPALVNIDDTGDHEFEFSAFQQNLEGFGGARAPNTQTGINASAGTTNGYAVRFLSNQSFGPGGVAGSFQRIVRLASNNTAGDNYGNFINGTTGFVGFRFNPGDGDRYGWIRLRLDDGGSDVDGLTDTVTVIDWAYESLVNTPIRIGDMGAIVPEPSSLTIVGLAMGCAALPALRRRRELRKAAASQAKE